MSKDKNRIDTSGNKQLDHNPFSALNLDGLPKAKALPVETKPDSTAQKKKVRLEIRREKSGRAGKTVTVIRGTEALEPDEADKLAKMLKHALSTGGTMKTGNIEIQGNRLSEVITLLNAAGYKAVQCGG